MERKFPHSHLSPARAPSEKSYDRNNCENGWLGMATVEIENLLEYPVIQGLAHALWRVGDLRGAAVMVGAGFSRNAEVPGPTSPKSPSWNQLASAMRQALGGHANETFDALEVAQQYEAVFGRQALDGLIRDQVPDLSLQPGALHRRLLRLPWAEVLTTNYDTLLERCAEKSPGQTFETVRSQGDIPRTRSPRIVKLHGTLPSGPFVISTEDYRVYPRRYAAMVNLVQQVLLENHLVLVGFSATDPNFLAWTGWVRDNLGELARRFVLVGIFDLSAGARRVLESRGVTVVDLSGLVADESEEDRHAVALGKFLTALERAKPSNPGTWELKSPPPTIDAPIPGAIDEGAMGPQHWFDPDAARRRLEIRIPAWISDRKTYPGWIVAPFHVCRGLATSLSSDSPQIVAAIQALVPPDRARAAYELAWRFDVAMTGMPTWLCSEIGLLLEPNTPASLSAREHFQLGLFALTAAREAREEIRFRDIRQWLDAHPVDDPDLQAMAAYEDAIWARDGLEFDRLSDLINRIGGQDPIFLMRRAALWCDLGAYEEAYSLITRALAELRELRVRDRNSIWVSSRYGWALYLARQAGWSSSVRKSKAESAEDDVDDFRPTRTLGDVFCDPMEELRNLDDELSRAERQAAERRIAKHPGFDAGAFTHHTYGLGEDESNISIVGDTAIRVALRAGMPDLFDRMNINRSRIDRFLEITNPILNAQLLPLCALIEKRKGGAIDRFLNRVSVANIEFTLVQEILARTMATIDTLLPFLDNTGARATGRHSHFLQNRLGILLEIASRLVIRLDATRAISVFLRGLAWARDPRWQHNWSSEPLGSLLSRALEVIPPSRQGDLLLEMVLYPLPGDKHFSHIARYWPEFSSDLRLPNPTPRPASPKFAAGVENLIERVRTGSEIDRGHAMLRLNRLHKAGVLTDGECEDLASALWGRLGQNGLPADTLLRKFVLLTLPEVTPGQALSALRATFLPKMSEIIMTADLADLLMAERTSLEGGGAYLALTADEALRCLDAVFAFAERQPTKSAGIFGDQDQTASAFGAALAVSILPALSSDLIGSARFERLISFMKSGNNPSVTQAWPQIVRLDPSYQSDARDSIIVAVLSNETDLVNEGLWAVERWLKIAKAEKLPPLPRIILECLIGIISTRRFIGLSGTLHIMAKCIEGKLIRPEEITIIITSLAALIKETISAEAALEDDAAAIRAGTLTLVRREAANLALTLSGAGVTSPILDQWKQIISNDPFPEVRSLAEKIPQT